MNHSEIRRTKIVATVGPASWDPPILEDLIRAGVDVFRLNFSHGDGPTHLRVIKDIREISERIDMEVGILGDLPGPKLRVGDYPGGIVDIVHGSIVTITPDEVDGTATLIPVDWPGLSDALRIDDTVYLADGSIRLRVITNNGHSVECEVEVGGPLSSHKGMNLPGVEAGLDSVSADDLRWVEFAVANQLDFIAVSFVRKADDLDPVLGKLAELKSDIPIIAKIEKPQAADAVEEIALKATGGIMVARGDLGIEVPLSKVPVLQKSLIRAAGQAGKTVITATQMLASMVSAKRPTRAEVTDVATAIYDGTDAIMLSEETAVGEYPVEAVQVMDQIARGTETDLPYWDWVLNRVKQEEMDVSDSVTQSAVIAAYRLGLKAIVVPTSSGRTAKVVAAHRPQVPVLAVTHSVSTQRQLKLIFGVRPVLNDQTTEIRNLLYECADDAVRFEAARSGDLIAIVAGLSDMKLGTNLFEVHRVP